MKGRKIADARVKEISDRLASMVETDHPLSNFILTFFKTMLDEWREGENARTPPPFGDSPLLELVESMLPSVEAQDQDSGEMIRCLLEKTRMTRDPAEKRTLGHALEWFYLYFTHKTDLDFERWLGLRENEPTH